MPHKETVLVVDDEPVNYLVLQGILGNNGYQVITAQSGPEARALAREHQPDLILLDVMMPEESGFDTCVKLMQDEATRHIPVVFLTCLDEVSNKIAGLDLGAVDYITKPFHGDEVLARIRALLKHSKSRDSIIAAQADRLNQVHSAQQAMLVAPQDVPEAGFGVVFVPVLEAGGDFYDVLDLGDGRFGYFVADVSGHDLGAGFITSSLKALLRQNAGPDLSPGGTLKAMNHVLCSITGDEMYLTACYAVLDRGKGELELACAGHPAVASLAAAGDEAVLLAASGDIIGMFPEVELTELRMRMDPGNRLFLYTDGLIEGSAGEVGSIAASTADLLDACVRTRGLPVQAAAEQMVESVRSAYETSDDIVLLAVEV